MDLIRERAREVGRLIAQTDEYKALKRANERLSDDRDAVTTINRLSELEGVLAEHVLDTMQAVAGAGFDGLDDGVDLAVDSTDEGERELALGGEGLLGEVEGAVHGAGDVDAGQRQG